MKKIYSVTLLKNIFIKRYNVSLFFPIFACFKSLKDESFTFFDYCLYHFSM